MAVYKCKQNQTNNKQLNKVTYHQTKIQCQ